MPLNTTLEIAEPTVLEQVKLIDAVAETEDKSPGDDRRNERCENLCGDGRCPLQDVLVPLRRLLYGILGHALDSGDGHEILVELRDRVPDDDLKLPCLCKAALYCFHGLDALDIGLLRVAKNKAHPRHAVRDGGNVVLSAHQFQKLPGILRVLPHDVFSSCCLANLSIQDS